MFVCFLQVTPLPHVFGCIYTCTKTPIFYLYIKILYIVATMSLQAITNGIILVWAGINVNANISVLNECKQKEQKQKK